MWEGEIEIDEGTEPFVIEVVLTPNKYDYLAKWGAPDKNVFQKPAGIAVDKEGMRKMADRIWSLERAFIVREGISRKDDVLVGRLANEPMRGGLYDGLRVDQQKWDKMLDEYYDLVGCDKETGVPTRATLESLGLKAVADELSQMEKL